MNVRATMVYEVVISSLRPQLSSSVQAAAATGTVASSRHAPVLCSIKRFTSVELELFQFALFFLHSLAW